MEKWVRDGAGPCPSCFWIAFFNYFQLAEREVFNRKIEVFLGLVYLLVA